MRHNCGVCGSPLRMIVIQWIEGVTLPDENLDEFERTLAYVEELERRPDEASREERMKILEQLAVDPQTIMHSGNAVRGRYWVMCGGDPPHSQAAGTWGTALATAAGAPQGEKRAG